MTSFTDDKMVDMLVLAKDDVALTRVAQLIHPHSSPSNARDRVVRWLTRRIVRRSNYTVGDASSRTDRKDLPLTWADRLAVRFLTVRSGETPPHLKVDPIYLSAILQRPPEEIEKLANSRSGIQGFQL